MTDKPENQENSATRIAKDIFLICELWHTGLHDSVTAYSYAEKILNDWNSHDTFNAETTVCQNKITFIDSDGAFPDPSKIPFEYTPPTAFEKRFLSNNASSPTVVTDEMVERGARAHVKHIYRHIKGKDTLFSDGQRVTVNEIWDKYYDENQRNLERESARIILTAALSTEESHDL